MCYEGYSGSNEYELLLPDGTPQLIITLDDNPRFGTTNLEDRKALNTFRNAWFTGLFTQPILYLSEQNASTLAIQFEPYGLSTLLGIPAQKLKNRMVEAELILNHSILDLREKLMELRSFQERIAAVEHFLLHTFTTKQPKTGLVKAVVHDQRFQEVTLKKISNQIGYSQKHIIHAFSQTIGTTPKKLQTLWKINKSLALLHSKRLCSVSQIALECGFFDQSHFIKSFRQITSMTPQAYLNNAKMYPNVISFD